MKTPVFVRPKKEMSQQMRGMMYIALGLAITSYAAFLPYFFDNLSGALVYSL
jgi:hypothetical protein